MSLLRVATALAGSFVVLAVSVQAQQGAAPATTTAAVETAAVPVPVVAVPTVAIATPAPRLLLPSFTEIVLTPDVAASSKELREGDVVPMHSLFDVMHNGVIVIPKGTPARGTVTWRTGKGAFGKSAKMEITFNELTLPNGNTLPLTGKHRQEGEGNSGAAIGAAVAVGVFGAFVTGKSAIVPSGQNLIARTGDGLPYAMPAGATVVSNAELAPAPAAVAAPVVETAPAAAPAAEPAVAPAEPVAATTPTAG